MLRPPSVRIAGASLAPARKVCPQSRRDRRPRSRPQRARSGHSPGTAPGLQIDRRADGAAARGGRLRSRVNPTSALRVGVTCAMHMAAREYWDAGTSGDIRGMMSIGSVPIAALLAALLGSPAFAQEIQTTLQVSPPAGGHCIAVPGAFAPEQRLQMQDCNNSPAQTFGYDQAKAQLRIGGLCVDADGGQPGDLVKLAPCNGGARQSWKLSPRTRSPGSRAPPTSASTSATARRKSAPRCKAGTAARPSRTSFGGCRKSSRAFSGKSLPLR